MSEQDKNKKEIDEISGVETTGHTWDGLKELNNPLPRWWVWIFIITCIWSIGYWVVFPSWPTLSGSTEGTSGYTQAKALQKGQAEIEARQQAYLERFEKASYQEILADPELYAFSIAGGKAAFKENCATCHGTGGAGSKGYPNLNDDDWLWGGRLDDIHMILQHGIRANNEDSKFSVMPAFGKEKILTREEIYEVVDYVQTLSGDKEPTEAYERGMTIYKNQCASCHGDDGRGKQDIGSPNLTDSIWLYGGDRKTLFETIYFSRAGVMPAWKNRLDENTLRQLTVYLYELSGRDNRLLLEKIEEENSELPQSEIIEAVEEIPGDESEIE